MRHDTYINNHDGTVTRRRYINNRLVDVRLTRKPGTPVFHRTPVQRAAHVYNVGPFPTGE